MQHKSGPLGEVVAKRLSRIAGHAAALKKMWDEERDCDEMLTQVAAVRAAMDQVAKLIFAHHIDHRIREAAESGDCEEVIQDLKDALDRFV